MNKSYAELLRSCYIDEEKLWQMPPEAGDSPPQTECFGWIVQSRLWKDFGTKEKKEAKYAKDLGHAQYWSKEKTSEAQEPLNNYAPGYQQGKTKKENETRAAGPASMSRKSPQTCWTNTSSTTGCARGQRLQADADRRWCPGSSTSTAKVLVERKDAAVD